MPLGADNNYTLLVMSPIGVPLYSARGLTQTLTPVAEAKPTPRRTINGELRWLGLQQMQKYESTISCTDQQAPRFDGIWPGQAVFVSWPMSHQADRPGVPWCRGRRRERRLMDSPITIRRLRSWSSITTRRWTNIRTTISGRFP